MYTPKHLSTWLRPSCYIGNEYPEYFVFFQQTRDSNAYERANFKALRGNVFVLPPEQLKRETYEEVAKLLGGISGKWDRKAKGFVFGSDPSELIEDLKGGSKRNLKKETQFFATPQDVALFMVCHLFNDGSHSVLEPSAGEGGLIDVFLRESYKGGELFWIEKDAGRNKHLQSKYKDTPNVYHLHPDGNDFLNLDTSKKFDRILANPPFSKGQDIDHVLKMWDCLAPKGRIVTVTSVSWTFNQNKKSKAFRQFVEMNEGETYELDKGSFKGSGTMVPSLVLILDKP